jgi:hypothetical protein
MAHLKLIDDQSSPSASAPTILPLAILQAGYRYQINCVDYAVLNATHGVVGDYRISSRAGEIVPVGPEIPGTPETNLSNACYFWDTGIDLSGLDGDLRSSHNEKLLPLNECQLKTSRLILTSAMMHGPELKTNKELDTNNEVTTLRLSPRFDFTFSTDAYAAQLGVIHLVQANRFIKLEDNREIVLLDTGIEDIPVLYLENSLDDQPVKLLSGQQEPSVTREHTCDFTISQPIPEKIDGARVATVTVLEQYCSYFMHKMHSNNVDESIWTPVYAPITWGWSIRVGRRTDGEWGILRRKLILPTTGNDGWQLPTWSNNTLNCSVSPE